MPFRQGRAFIYQPAHMTLLTTRALLAKTDDERLRYSEEFEDPHQLLAAAVTRAESLRHRVEARRSALSLPGWIKVKTATWREANRDRDV